MIHIRRAVDDEIPEILDMDRVCFPHDERPDFAGATWWIAEGLRWDGEAEPLAYAAAQPASTTSGAVYLARCGVLPVARGGGLQRRLIRARERWARANGYIAAVTDTNDPASMRSLIRCGYLPFTPVHPWARSDSTYWRRQIAAGEG